MLSVTIHFKLPGIGRITKPLAGYGQFKKGVCLEHTEVRHFMRGRQMFAQI